MGLQAISQSETVANATVVTNAETVACQLDGVCVPYNGTIVKLLAMLNISLAASTTSVQLRVRRGSVTGTVVADTGPITSGIAASSRAQLVLNDGDQPGEYAGSYVLTVQTVGAAANHTINSASLQAIVGG